MKKIKKTNLVINGIISLGVIAAGIVALLPKNAEAEKSVEQLDK